MPRHNGDASDFGWSCSCTSCIFKSTSGCPLEEIIFVRSYMNKLYYGTYLPMREQKINELIKTIANNFALGTISKSNTSFDPKVHEKTISGKKREFNNKNNYANNDFYRNYGLHLHPRESAQEVNYVSGEGTDSIRNIGVSGTIWSQRIARLQSRYRLKYNTKLIKSDPCTSLQTRTISKRQLTSQQYKINEDYNKIRKRLASKYSQTIQSLAFESSQVSCSGGYEMANNRLLFSSKDIFNKQKICNISETSIWVILSKLDDSNHAESWNSSYRLSGSFLFKPCSTSTLSSGSTTNYTVLLVSAAGSQKIQEKRLRFVIGPYAQMQTVYNVMEQTTAEMKEKGTSQQFKKKSQGIGTGSGSQPVSSTNDSSTGTPKRRAIKIESSVSFSIEFFKKGKSTASDIPGHEEIAAQKGPAKVKGDKKKSLHRCFCTMSFPTEGRKPEKCASGICVPGECDPKECFKQIEQKYAKKKKKSASDVSSSQASQTRKTKAKEERAGKETVVKEKGSSSISKYKESVEIKPPPEKKEEKVSLATYLTKCCEKLQFWKKGEKDKPIELKRTATDTDIAGKTAGTPYGANVSTQSGKTDKKAKKVKKDKKSKETAKETPSKEAKKGTDKKAKKAAEKETPKKGEGDNKPTGKKGKKAAAKEEKKDVTEIKAPAAAEAKKKTSKKDKKAKGKETSAAAAAAEVKKPDEKKSKKAKGKETPAAAAEVKKPDEKKGKKAKGKETPAAAPAEVKKPDEKKGKKAKESKKDKKADEKAAKKTPEEKGKKPTKKELKKTVRHLKPYECEPGVCSPKVCSPQECYERKFPPPPKVEVKKLSLLETLLQKCCCRPALAREQKAGVSSNAATQSRRPTGPDRYAGATVYKEIGFSSPKKLKSGGNKAGEAPPEFYDQPTAGGPRVDVGVPLPSPVDGRGRERRVDAGVPQYTAGGEYDVPVDSKGLAKQRALTGVQYYQNVDNELKTKRQGVNIGSECSCSVEFYKMIF